MVVMKADPAIVQLVAENVRAEVLQRPAGLKLERAIVEKIAAKVQVFQGMEHDCLMRTLAMAEHMPFAPGEVVFHEGDIGTSFHVLIAGEVVVEKGREGGAVELARLHPGECFGEMALVRNRLRSATVRAFGAASTMRIDRERLDAYPDSARVVYRNIARILAGRLEESSELLADLVAGRH